MKKEKLALELAEALGDMESLTVYRAFAEQYAESYLRKIQLKVLSIPDEKIRKTRGALFTYLVKEHGKRGRDRFRD